MWGCFIFVGDRFEMMLFLFFNVLVYVKKSSYVGFVLVKFFLFYNFFFNIEGLLYRFILIIKCCYLVCFILLIKYVNLILDNC